eukprot:scaffold7394_cov35-Tisochrysis_lutea.AAC.1
MVGCSPPPRCSVAAASSAVRPAARCAPAKLTTVVPRPCCAACASVRAAGAGRSSRPRPSVAPSRRTHRPPGCGVSRRSQPSARSSATSTRAPSGSLPSVAAVREGAARTKTKGR